MKCFGRSFILAVSVLVLAAGSALAAATVDSASDLSSMSVRTAETSLGDLVADAIRASQGADIALVSASELKEMEVAKGKLSSADITSAIAYPDDPVVLVQLSGSQVKKALEKSVSIYEQKNLGFLQVSGLRFSFKKGTGDRVSSVTINGEPLDSGKEYRVAMSNSLANGALGYWRVWTKDEVVGVSKTTVPQSIEDFLKGRDSIDYSTQNRINVTK